MAVHQSVLELIGNTPVVQVRRLDTGPCELFLKLEIKPPEEFKPRMKPKPKLRGREDYATPQVLAPPSPVSRAKTKPL